MAVVEPAASGELLSERVAGGILPKVLNSFDMVAIFAAIVLFITNAAVIQSAGPTAFGWWVLGFLAFLIPSAIVTGQLGVVFPGTVGSWNIQAQGALIIAFIVVSAVLAVLRFRVTQNIVNVVFVLYGVAIALMLIAGVVHLARGRQAQVDPTALSAWAPSRPTGLNFTNWTFFGLVILALLGVEVPLNMGVEIKHTRSITRYLFWGSLTVMAAYLIATWAVMVTVPAAGGRSAQVTAVAEAVRLSLGTFWGDLVALILAGFFLFITVVYN